MIINYPTSIIFYDHNNLYRTDHGSFYATNEYCYAQIPYLNGLKIVDTFCVVRKGYKCAKS
jgi:hypothetical protein